MAWRKPTNVREWIAILFRHKKKFFFPSVLVMIAVVWYGQFLERQYTATARFRSEKDSALAQAGNDAISRNLAEMRTLMAERLKGRRAIEQLIKDLEMTRDWPRVDGSEKLTQEGEFRFEELIRRLQSRINVSFDIRSDSAEIVRVSFTDPDRALAPRVVNQVVENYVVTTRQDLDRRLIGQKTFFDGEVAALQRKIDQLSKRKLDFERDYPSVVPDSPTALYDELERLKRDHDQIVRDLSGKRARLEKLKAFIAEQPEWKEVIEEGTNPELQVLQERLMALQAEYDAHRAMRRRDAHPAVKATLEAIEKVKKDMADKQQMVQTSVQRVPNTERITTERMIKELQADVESLQSSASKIVEDLETKSRNSRQYHDLRKDYQTIEKELAEAQEQLKFWEENLRRTTMALHHELSERGVRLVFDERAPDVAKPSSPSILSIATMALLLGLGTGAGLVILGEFLDHSYHTTEQAIDGLKLPVLGAVNEIVSSGQAFRRRVLGWAVYPVLGTVMVLVLVLTFSMMYMSLEKPHEYEGLNPVDFLKKVVER